MERCDQCGYQKDEEEMIMVTDTNSQVYYFHSIECLKDWAEEQVDAGR